MATTYDDGQLVQVSGTSPVYLIVLGEACWVPNPATFDNLFVQARWKQIQQISKTGFDTIPPGPPLTDGAYLAKVPTSAPQYLVSWGMANHISGPDAVQRYGFNEQALRTVTQQQIDSLGKGWTIH